ncbi:UNVERIFIED_CONTAM: hypothetical protein K2H54_068261 [Gekko kuhli]
MLFDKIRGHFQSVSIYLGPKHCHLQTNICHSGRFSRRRQVHNHIQQITAGLFSQSDNEHALDYKCPIFQYCTTKVIFHVPYPNAFESETLAAFAREGWLN